MKALFGFVGLRRSGKDTAAAALQDDGFRVFRFAGALKAMLTTYLVCRGATQREIERLLEGDLKETPSRYFEGRSARHAMQTLGTEWGRNLIHDSLWVNTCMAQCRTAEKAVVADVRFRNEVDAIHAAGGKIIRIIRHGTFPDGHPSEASINDLPFDCQIINSGTIPDLCDRARACVAFLTP